MKSSHSLTTKVILLFILLLLFQNFYFKNQSLGSKENWKVLLSAFSFFKGDRYIVRFNSKIKELEGKTIELEGYMYPLEVAPKHKYFFLSYYPANACFFCGGAGPETIVEIRATKAIKFSTKKIKVKGKLKLNDKGEGNIFYKMSGVIKI